MNFLSILLRILLLFLISSFLKVYAQNFWKSTKGPVGGYVHCIATNKNGEILSGFHSGRFGPEHLGNSLYLSSDRGASWKSLLYYGNKEVQSITVDTSGNIFIYVWGSGVRKSTNNGLTWSGTSPGALNNGMIASFNNNYLILGQDDGLYLSTDNGDSWNLNSLQGNFSYVFVDDDDNAFVSNESDLFKSTDFGNSWLMSSGIGGEVASIAQISDTRYFASNYMGIFYSYDSGNTWNLLKDSPINTLSLLYFNNNLFAATLANGILVSSDKGRSWIQRNNGLKCYNITTIVQLLPNQIIIGTYGDGIYTSSDNGEIWSPINEGIKSVTVTSFLEFGNYLFAGSEQGILYTTQDLGNNWSSVDSIYTRLPINSFASSLLGSLFFACNNGIFKSVDIGKTWSQIANTAVLKMTTHYEVLTNTEYIYAATHFSGVQRSTDDGKSWVSLGEGLSNLRITDIVTNSIGNVFVTDDRDIYRKTNYGANWELIYKGTTSISDINLAVSCNDYLYAGLSWGKVILSTNNGNSWIDRGENLNVNRINSITTDSSNQVFVGNWDGYIFQSTDFGVNWRSIRQGSIGGAILNLYCGSNGNIFLGAYGGSVFKNIHNLYAPFQVSLHLPSWGAENISLNPKLSWYSRASAIFYNLQVATNVNFDSSGTILNINISDTSKVIGPLLENTRYYWRVLASNKFGNSSWSEIRFFNTMIVTALDDSASLILAYNLYQNYPNPFNPSTKIKFTISDFGFVTLKVYDVLGNEVAILVNEERPAGDYEVVFNAADLTSGIYFYKLQSGKFVEIKKMILLK